MAKVHHGGKVGKAASRLDQQRDVEKHQKLIGKDPCKPQAQYALDQKCEPNRREVRTWHT